MNENIARYLNKYRKLEPPQDHVKDVFIGIIQNEFETAVLKEHIQVSKGVIYVDAASHLKNRIFVKKDFLVSKLRDGLGDKAPQDIR